MNDPLIKKTTLPFLITSAIFLVLNGIVVLSNMMPQYDLNDGWWNFVFLAPISYVGLYYVAYRYGKTQKVTSIGKNYLLYTALKMVLAILFLLPWLLNKDESAKPMVIHFFILFFPFLLVETILLVRLLNTPLGEKNKNEENQ